LKDGTHSLLRQLVWDGETKIFKIINLGIFMSLKLIDGTDMQTLKILFSFNFNRGGQDARQAV
jgi:hypothetical protein